MIARHTVSLPTSTSVVWMFQRVYIIASHCEENRNSKGGGWVTSKMRCSLRILQLIVSRQGGE